MSENQKDVSTLLKAIDILVQNKYGAVVPPPAYITPFGIRPLDAILGGGLSSGLPVAFCSTPETGKSSVAFQFSASFLKQYPNSIVLYIDTETASNTRSDNGLDEFINSRIETLGIDKSRFKYFPIVVDIPEFFNIVDEFIAMKKTFEEKTGQEVKLLIVWDSMASTHSSKDITAKDPKEVTGYRAREFSLHFTKIKPAMLLQNVTFICIDQVRRNFKIDMYARSEKSVGEFGDYKSATSVTQFQHNVKQWLFFSKGQELKPSESYGVDGWILNCYTEKNKIAPSKYWISLVFDKRRCIDKILTEFHFLAHPTITESKVFGDNNVPLFAVSNGPRYKIKVFNPETGTLIGETESFFLKDLKDKYEKEEQFRKAFDFAVELSVSYRIKHRLFNVHIDLDEQEGEETEDTINTEEE